MTTTIGTAQHVAHLDALTGVGLLVLPPTTQTVALDLEVLTEVDYSAMLERLDALGWHLLVDDDGLPWVCLGSAGWSHGCGPVRPRPDRLAHRPRGAARGRGHPPR